MTHGYRSGGHTRFLIRRFRWGACRAGSLQVLLYLAALANAAWLPNNWESADWLASETDSCLRVMFLGKPNGHLDQQPGESCGTTFPATWQWSVDGTPVAAVQNFPAVVLEVPPRYGAVVRYVLQPGSGNTCPLEGTYTLTKAWHERSNDYSGCVHPWCGSGARPFCPGKFAQIFADGFESSDTAAWSVTVVPVELIYADGFETGDALRWSR